MKALFRVGLCVLVAQCLMAQRGGGGHAGGGGGFHGGGGFAGGGVRGGGFGGGVGVGRGFGGFGGARGFGGFRGYGRFGFGLGYGYPYGWGFGGYPYDYGDYGDYYDYTPYISSYPSYSYPSYEYNPSPNVTIIYPQQPSQPSTYNLPVQPAMRTYDQYGQQVTPAPAPAYPNASAGSPIYLVAAKDGVIRAAASYWVEGRTLHYVTLQHEEKQVSLDSLDRALTLQLNRERHVAFNLPQ